MAVLRENPAGEVKRPPEDGLKLVLAGDLPGNVTDGAPEIGLELAKGLAGALELMGVGVTLMPDQCQLADAPIGLAEIDPNLSGQPDQALARPVEELGIGREHHVLGLNGGVEDHPLVVSGFIAPVFTATARLSWRSEAIRSSPIRWRQRVIDERSKGSAWQKNSSPQKYWK